MPGCVNEVEAVPRQPNVKGLDEVALRKFVRHEHVAANADALASDHRLDGMELLSEAQVIHLVELGYIAPFGPRGHKPSLPSGSFGVRRKPIAMNQGLTPQVRHSPEVSIG